MEERKAGRKRAPARTPKARESQLVDLAMTTAEEKMRNGTASSQIIVHFLKLGTELAKLELEKLRADVALSEKKVDIMESQQRSEEIAEKALEAFRSYSGFYDSEDDEWDD